MTKPKIIPFAQVPLEVLYNPKLSTSARTLYAIVLSKVNKEGYCYATNETLAEWLGTTERTVRRNLKELKTAELVKTFNEGLSRKIYPQIVIKGEDKNMQKRETTVSTYNSLSKERQRRVVWQKPSSSSAADSNESTPNEK
jgi:predicted transcriptional regulator